ncbi:MAG: hypothetical protein AAGA60_29640, partial [Cyanobacteria bacterium P01_E01_bin.42]
KSRCTEYLKIRLYQHCTFSFTLITENIVFVEQYCYRYRAERNDLPVIKYHSGSQPYSQLDFSINVIWDYALAAEQDNMVGTTEAIWNSKILNIYRTDQRYQSGQRQLESIRNSHSQETIDILAVTAKFYVSEPLVKSLEIKGKNGTKEYKKVRIAIINPISQAAILRAIADSSPPEEIKQELEEWSWERHNSTKLFADVYRTITYIQDCNNLGGKFHLRLYSSHSSCAFLRTDEAIFLEQYFYGRGRTYQEGLVLGKEYPIFEFQECKDTYSSDLTEQRLIKSHFNVIWTAYSIPFEEYLEKDHQKEFERNLSSLKVELAG